MPPRRHAPPADLSDDDIVVLDKAPVHMRPKQRAAPILVLSSDEDEPGPSAPKRPRSSSSPILIERMPVRKRNSQWLQAGDSAHSAAANGGAGPSNHRARGSDLHEPQGPILPKAGYLVDLVVDIIPDICRNWVEANLTEQIAALAPTSNVPAQDAVRVVIDMAFAMDAYPKAGQAGVEAAPQAMDAHDGQYTDPNYRRDKRVGITYRAQALEVLEGHFTMIPVGYIRQIFQAEGGHQLIPTFLILSRQQAGGPGLFVPLRRGRTDIKGKNRAALPDEDEWFNDPIVVRGGPDYHDPSGDVELRREKKQMLALIRKEKETKNAEAAAAQAAEKKQAADAKARADAIKAGTAAECGCCFDMDPLTEMVSCESGHLFCKSCVKSLAENKLGEQLTTISCMDISGCAKLFTETTLAKVLPAKTLELYHRLKQDKDLEMAAIEGLESCPFCPYAVVIDNEAEKLFRCLNSKCMKVTCRKCKRPDHIPKRCEEVEADLKLNNRHAVEEAMSEALMRKCPKCSKPYVKEHGCNKIICQSCSTMSCYICQKAIPEGYAHFDQAPGRPATKATAAKCRLWDQNEAQSEARRIRQARDTAQERILARAAQEGVQLNADDLRVDAPEAAAPRNPVAHGVRPGQVGQLAQRVVQAMEAQRQAIDAQRQAVDAAVNNGRLPAAALNDGRAGALAPPANGAGALAPPANVGDLDAAYRRRLLDRIAARRRQREARLPGQDGPLELVPLPNVHLQRGRRQDGPLLRDPLQPFPLPPPQFLHFDPRRPLFGNPEDIFAPVAANANNPNHNLNYNLAAGGLGEIRVAVPGALAAIPAALAPQPPLAPPPPYHGHDPRDPLLDVVQQLQHIQQRLHQPHQHHQVYLPEFPPPPH